MPGLAPQIDPAQTAPMPVQQLLAMQIRNPIAADVLLQRRSTSSYALPAFSLLLCMLCACTGAPDAEPAKDRASTAPAAPPAVSSNERIPAAMPAAVSNNAVAIVSGADGPRMYSFLGLGPGRSHADIVRSAYEYDPQRDGWTRLEDVPVEKGRLAATAAAAQGAVFLFGGYTVAADGHEVSTPDVLRFDPGTRSWQQVAPMPLPVDDSVALVLADRWIYLVSGWHQDRNVDRVQVYDAREDRWHDATPFPGTPVFGHAGALSMRDDGGSGRILVCDGVRLDVIAGKRTFSASAECWRGVVDAAAPERIDWQPAPPHPGPPRYRMGATADPAGTRLLFVGGSENPYNYDGIGYDGRPSAPSARAQAFDLDSGEWSELPPLPVATMDHRGLLAHDGGFWLLGGMRAGQRVDPGVVVYRPEVSDPVLEPEPESDPEPAAD